MEGAIASSLAILILMGTTDVGLAFFVAVNMDNATARATEVFQINRDPVAALAAAQAAMSPIAANCLTLKVYGWSKIPGVDVRSSNGGTLISSASVTTDSAGNTFQMAAIKMSCQWGWLTPPLRGIAGSTVTFNRTDGTALE